MNTGDSEVNLRPNFFYCKKYPLGINGEEPYDFVAKKNKM